MPPQPLAFTLVKTVVTARDQGRALAPAFATTWAMLHDELQPEQRVLSEHVHWGPEHQEELRRVIEGVRACLGVDPALEAEIATFVSQHEALREEVVDAVTDATTHEHSAGSADPPEDPTATPGAASDLHRSAEAEGVLFTHEEHATADASLESDAGLDADPTPLEIDADSDSHVPTEAPHERGETSGSDDCQAAAESLDATSAAVEPTSSSASSASAVSAIPMIVLEPDFFASFEGPAGSDEELPAEEPPAEGTAGQEPFATQTARAAEASDPRDADHMTVVALPEPAVIRGDTEPPHGMPRAEVPPPPIPVFPDATRPQGAQASKAGQTERNRLFGYVVLGSALLLLLAASVYLAMRDNRRGDAGRADAADEASPAPQPSTTEVAPAPVLPIAPEAQSLAERGDWAGAQVAQAAYAHELDGSAASAVDRADAFRSLGEYADAAGDFPGAISAQKRGLALTKDAHGVDAPAVGDAHLTLARYYVHNREPHMARAHLLQGRHLIERATTPVTPEREAMMQQLAEELD